MDGSRSQLRLYWDRTLDANSKKSLVHLRSPRMVVYYMFFFLGGVLFFWDGMKIMKSLDSCHCSKLSYLFAIRHMST